MGIVKWTLSVAWGLAALVSFGLPTVAADPTLAVVKKRGQLACGVNGNLAAFSILNDKKERVGFDAEYCRAIAAAALGDATKVNFVAVPPAKRFEALKSGEVDVLVHHSIVTMEHNAGTGVRNAAITYIDGQAFVVSKLLGANTLQGLDKQTICVTKDSRHKENVETWFALRGLSINASVFDDQDAMYKAFFAGRCTGVTQEATLLASAIIGSGKATDYLMLPEIISSEPIGPYVRAGDDQWFDIVHWTHNALVEAEERGIFQANVDDQRNSKDPAVRRLLGSDPGNGKLLGLDESWAYNAIKQVGNYGEIYERNFGAGSPLRFGRGVNALWRKGGVMYSLPMR
jgi:general L-amino acid transport system substrate-binding protein